jgi:subtilisin family serine protease/pimeloyl-ACP methyl ester carboxylesterase
MRCLEVPAIFFQKTILAQTDSEIFMSSENLDFLHHPGFHWQTARALAECSQLAYRDAKAISHLAFRHWGFSNIQYFEVADSHAFLAHKENVAILAFRGAERVAEWLANLNTESVKTANGRVHKGFNDRWNSLKPSIAEAMNRLPAPVRSIWLAGHDLGGAIALLAAADLKEDLRIAGVYTFGQPSVGDTLFNQTVDNRFPNSYVRFVNEDDVVTRLPPGFLHAGCLVHLNGAGQAQSELLESVGPLELPALSLEDSEAIRAEIEAVEAATRIETPFDTPFQQSTESYVGGMFPSIVDHRIARYIAAIRRNISNEDTDVSLESLRSSSVKSMAGTVGLESAVPRGMMDESVAIPVLLRIRSEKWEAYSDLRINSRLGTIVTANATPVQIERLRKDPDVASIDVSQDAGHHECSVSVPFVGGDVVQVPPLDERGSNAIVGLIDSGIDVLHRAFLNASGKSRIIAVWDQKDATGPSPKKLDSATYTQDYGTLYDEAAIQQFFDTTNAPVALRDPALHGTHVASIAAGRNVGAFAGGMAPEARIAVVIPHMQTIPGAPPSIGYSVSHVDALLFLRSLSKQQNLPIAINVSLGMNAGAHDGMSTLETAFDTVSGKGGDPGIAIVKSAGNERGFAGHAKIQVTAGGVATLTWESLVPFRLQDYIEVWYSGDDELEFVLKAPDGSSSAVVSDRSTKVLSNLGGNRCSFELTPNHPLNGDSLLAIRIRPDETDIQVGEWKLDVTGVSVFSGGRVDAWVERDDKARAVKFTSGDNDEMTLSIPGTADTVITVAACLSSLPTRLTTNSSFGPTRKGNTKPELAAPGENVIAAMANDPDSQAVTSLSGTSMAAPHVTGAIALAFSMRNKNPVRPQLSAQQIRRNLIKTLRNRSPNHNVGFGFGVLNAKAFLESLT